MSTKVNVNQEPWHVNLQMQQRWLFLVYNQDPRCLCCRLLFSLFILTLFTAPLYVPLTEINLLVTVVPFCKIQKQVL